MLALALLVSGVPAHAQLVGGEWESTDRFDGSASQDLLGYSVASAGDVDGDGTPDLIVGARNASPSGLSLAGSAYVYSGASGLLLHQFDGGAPDDHFGAAVAGAGDVDGDGIADLIVGAADADPGGLQGAGSVYVFSGATGALHHQRDGVAASDHLGRSVASAGDLNGDGLDDVIVGADGAAVGGEVYALSGPTGGLLHLFGGVSSSDFFGRSVATAGDADGDGIADLLVGAPGAGFGGRAYLYSGASGALLRQFFAPGFGEFFGVSVSGVGDTNGDGVPDLLIGAWTAIPSGVAETGSAYLHSGATGSLLLRYDGGFAGDLFGGSVAGAGDVDGDGVGDLLVGAQNTNVGGFIRAGSVFVFSGASGDLLIRFDGDTSYGQMGRSVAGALDVDGDGLDDMVMGAPFASSPGLSENGAAYVYSLNPYLHLDSESLSVSSGSSVHLGMDYPASEAGVRFVVLASTTGTGPIVMHGLEIPLTQDNVFNAIAGGNAPALLQGAFGTLNPNGQALASLSAGPGLAAVIGQTIYFAAVTYDVAPLTGRMSSVVRYLSIVP